MKTGVKLKNSDVLLVARFVIAVLMVIPTELIVITFFARIVAIRWKVKKMELPLEEIKRIREATKNVIPPESSGGIAIYTCPICNKRFTVADATQWVFKRRIDKNYSGKSIYVCSYPCIRKYDQAHGRI